LSNANAITIVSVAARLLAKAAAFLDQPAGKNFHTQSWVMSRKWVS
jgi:hypothetical protein